MKTLAELKQEKIRSLGVKTIEAESCVCQEVIINKIAKSELADKTFLKRGFYRQIAVGLI